MEKNQDMPPPYNPTNPNPGIGYGQPQNPPTYYAGYNQGPPGNVPQQQFGQAPPPQFQYAQYSQYPNVVVQQPVACQPASGPPPPDHMTAAIFVTVCCFWPTGIIAIIKASEAKNAYMRGDSTTANIYARTAKNMVTVSLIAGICSIILVAVIIGLYCGLFLSSYNDYDD